MIISLIQTSQNRRKELERFVKSLNGQTNIDLSEIQLIFIDQGDNREVFNDLDAKVSFVYHKTERCSLSHARNLGLKYATGKYVAFSDDDCWYDCDTFHHVIQRLQKGFDGVFGIVMNENGLHCNVFPSEEQRLTYTHHCGAMSASMFLKFDANLKFDENIGVGSPYNLGSGEETDYLLSYMEHHHDFNFFFTPEIIVRHPVGCINDVESYIKKQYSYARGAGYVLRKHKSLPLSYKLLQFIRPMCGMVLYSLTNKIKAKKSFFLIKGRIEGFFYRIR